MKAIILVCLLLATTMASSDFKSTLTNLVNMQTKAVDAVDSALDLLRSLKQQNVDAQARADKLNATQEQERGAQIADLTTIADNNKDAGNKATAHREHIQEEIQVTSEYLQWINNRRKALNEKRETLREHRCYANLMFIKALKEHDEALEVIRWLREDILGVVNGGETEEGTVDLAQISDASQKLQAYAHLFTQNQLKAFAALQDDHSRQAVDAETAEWDDHATDNNRDALELQHSSAGTESRDVGQKLLDAVDRLEEHLENSIKDLEASEIRAAWDLSQWLQDAEAELIHLDEEQATKTTYLDKLLIAIIGAKAREDKAWEIYFESASALNDAIDSLNELRAWYAQEKARRQEENAVLDEVIAMFLERVQTIDKNMRTKVNDYAEDGDFDQDIARRTDNILNTDGGKLGQNIASESRH